MNRKAIFIAYNQALHGLIIKCFEELNIKGYTQWEDLKGAGSRDGEPHLGTHAWPTLNGSMLAVISAEKVQPLLDMLRRIDADVPKQGLRAFVWSVEDGM